LGEGCIALNENINPVFGGQKYQAALLSRGNIHPTKSHSMI
jgi:hypothetical protein